MIVEDVGVGLSSPAAICRVHFEQLECYDDLQLGIDVPWRNDRLDIAPLMMYPRGCLVCDGCVLGLSLRYGRIHRLDSEMCLSSRFGRLWIGRLIVYGLP